jgi:DNA-binding CsgD family transcriptional regulator
MAGNPSTDARLLQLLEEIHGVVELAELREALLVALERAVPSDYVSINEIRPDPKDIVVLMRPEVPELEHKFALHAHENPLIQRFARTRDTRAYRFSDVVTPDELHALTLYREVYEPLRAEHQIAFVIRTGPAFLVGLAMSRADPDYTDDERDLLNRARPFLIQAYRDAIARDRLTAELQSRLAPADALVAALREHGLTPREADVLSCTALGRSGADTAGLLGVSERTVGKHLERCYRKLGVTGRSEAAAFAWGLIGLDTAPTARGDGPGGVPSDHAPSS